MGIPLKIDAERKDVEPIPRHREVINHKVNVVLTHRQETIDVVHARTNEVKCLVALSARKPGQE